MTPNEYERVATHTAVAKVARLMGYTAQGLKELCRSCNVDYEWRTIGITRPRFSQPIERVNARLIRPTNGDAPSRYEFSIGSEAFALTESASEQQRIRNEVADQVVRRISEARPRVNPTFIKRNQDQQDSTSAAAIKEQQALSRPQPMIISPVAPRDPRGLEAAQRRLSAPGNGMSGL